MRSPADDAHCGAHFIWYVVEEMMLLRLPIVAYDLGAPAERLHKYAASRLCGEVSARAALAALVEYREELSATRAVSA